MQILPILRKSDFPTKKNRRDQFRFAVYSIPCTKKIKNKAQSCLSIELTPENNGYKANTPVTTGRAMFTRLQNTPNFCIVSLTNARCLQGKT